MSQSNKNTEHNSFFTKKFLKNWKHRKENKGICSGFIELPLNELERALGVIYSRVSSHRAAKGEVPDNSELDAGFSAFT